MDCCVRRMIRFVGVNSYEFERSKATITCLHSYFTLGVFLVKHELSTAIPSRHNLLKILSLMNSAEIMPSRCHSSESWNPDFLQETMSIDSHRASVRTHGLAAYAESDNWGEIFHNSRFITLFFLYIFPAIR